MLGVLRDAPAHGYRLAQSFAAGSELSLLYPMEQSVVYALLHDLEARGFIEGEQQTAGQRPPRTMFAITVAGQAYFNSWLCEPVEPLRRVRLDFLLKLYFALRQNPAQAGELVSAQLAVGNRYLASLDEELRATGPDSLGYLVLESKRAAVQSFVLWLESRQRRLEAGASG